MVIENILNLSPWIIIVFIIVQIWDLVWKAIGLWRSGRNNHLGWFIAILIFNTIGILPLIYLGWFDKSRISKKKKR